MNERRLLILLTNYYPYYKGEEYIENEISVASNNYDEILIVPTMATRKMPLTREIPENSSTINMDIDYTFLGRLKMMIWGTPRYLRNKKVHEDAKLSMKKRLYAFYYEARTEFVYSAIKKNKEFKKIINKYNESNITIYSYWLHITASVSVRIKERIFHNHAWCFARGHRYDLYDYAAPCKYIPDRNFMLERIDKVYACSNDGAEYLKKQYGKFAKKIDVSRLGTIDHGTCRCTRTPYFSIVSCSAIRKVKRLDRIIDIIAKLLQKGYQVKWIHLGDGPYMRKIEELAKKTLPEDRYSFQGHLDNSLLFEWYDSHEVSCFVNVSDSEGVPVAIMEAMSCGIPIVATNVGGTREIVDDGKNGYVVSTSWSNEEIASTVERMITLPEDEYKEVCKMSRTIWETKCNAKTLYEQLYNGILCEQSGE